MKKDEKYERDCKNLKNILEKLRKENERKLHARDFMDTLDFIKDNVDKEVPNEYPRYIDFQPDRIRFNFWTYYDELEDYCSNDVVISKNYKDLSIKMNYGKVNFYDSFEMGREGVKKVYGLPQELIFNDENSLYEINPDEPVKETSKEENVIAYYVLCSKLKDIVRTGWKDWKVSRERIESVAEHIYKAQQLALAMKYTYHYDIDIFKVIMMIAIHETEEIVIGDLTTFQISQEEKRLRGHKAVREIFENVLPSIELESLIYEFDERKTKEARFAYECDKLECDLQARLYDLENCVDIHDQDDNKTADDPVVRSMLSKGASFSDIWMAYGENRYNYDKNFKSVANYARTHNIDEYGSMLNK